MSANISQISRQVECCYSITAASKKPDLKACLQQSLTDLNELTQLHDALLVTRVSVTKLIGCSSQTGVQFSSSDVNEP